MNHNEEKAINAAAADGEQATERQKYMALVITSVVRANEAERIRNDIYQKLGGDGVTVCDLNAEIRPLTDQEWRELQMQLNQMGDADQCQRCASPLNGDGYCTDETCPFSDHPQTDDAGWYGHPDKDLQG